MKPFFSKLLMWSLGAYLLGMVLYWLRLALFSSYYDAWASNFSLNNSVTSADPAANGSVKLEELMTSSAAPAPTLLNSKSGASNTSAFSGTWLGKI